MIELLLPGDFVAGLVEGEGCFILQYRREVKRNRLGSPSYFRWFVAFAIVLRNDDAPLLNMIKKSLGCGSLSYTRNSVRFQVQDAYILLKKIVPFFNKFRLHGKKAKDFALWKEAVGTVARNRYIRLSKWSEDDAERLHQIRNQMKIYKSQGPEFKWEIKHKGSGTVYDAQ